MNRGNRTEASERRVSEREGFQRLSEFFFRFSEVLSETDFPSQRLSVLLMVF